MRRSIYGPRFTGVVTGNFEQRLVREGNFLRRKPLAWRWRGLNTLGNAGTVFGVAVELDNLHAVAQRFRYGLQLVGRGNKHDIAQVEVDVQIVVTKGAVLGRVEHFQQRAAGVATPVLANFINLIQYEDRVACPSRLMDWMMRPGMAPM